MVALTPDNFIIAYMINVVLIIFAGNVGYYVLSRSVVGVNTFQILALALSIIVMLFLFGG